MDRWTEMEVLVQIAETGTLSGAADALGLSSSSASRYLASLEDRLGASLVAWRTAGRGVAIFTLIALVFIGLPQAGHAGAQQGFGGCVLVNVVQRRANGRLQPCTQGVGRGLLLLGQRLRAVPVVQRRHLAVSFVGQRLRQFAQRGQRVFALQAAQRLVAQLIGQAHRQFAHALAPPKFERMHPLMQVAAVGLPQGFQFSQLRVQLFDALELQLVGPGRR